MLQVKAGDVMDRSAILLNDSNKNYFTYTILLPHLQVAYDEMREELELYNVQITNLQSGSAIITTAMTDWGGNTGPALPQDLVAIQQLFERLSGSAEDFQEITRTEFLPPYVQKVEALIYWAWQNQTIQFLGATQNREVMMHYIGDRSFQLVDQNSIIPMFNAKTFLSYRTAGLAASFIGENQARADQLNFNAQTSLDRLTGIATKDKQTMTVRRRPFMSRYKVRGY